jgi:hypothetical protein
MNVIWKEPQPKLCTRSTNWQLFQEIIKKYQTKKKRIKENKELEEVVHYLTKLIQEAARQATPPPSKRVTKSQNIPIHIQELVAEKRTRTRLQRTRNTLDKRSLNRLTHQLRTLIQSLVTTPLQII